MILSLLTCIVAIWFVASIASGVVAFFQEDIKFKKYSISAFLIVAIGIFLLPIWYPITTYQKYKGQE